MDRMLADGCFYNGNLYFIVINNPISKTYKMNLNSLKIEKIETNLNELYYGITITNNKIYLLSTDKIIVIDLVTLQIIDNIYYKNYNNTPYYCGLK